MGSTRSLLRGGNHFGKAPEGDPACFLAEDRDRAVLGVILAFIIIQKVLKINKFVLGGVIFIGGGLVWFNWIYHRTEPKFLTPLVDRIAPFFPSAGAYDAKQAGNPGDSKK